MKLKKVLLRWYKSFHVNYRGTSDKGESQGYHPWNSVLPHFVPEDNFPFIEISVEDDITTIVGANESGKSHLLNAISKVRRGTGIDEKDIFKKTDLCHYSSIRTHNTDACPNIGLYFSFTDPSEYEALSKVLGGTLGSTPSPKPLGFAVVLTPEDENSHPAVIFIEPNPSPIPISDKQLQSVRNLLPTVQYIDSHAQLASEVSISHLLAACKGTPDKSIGLIDRKSVELAARQIQD